MMVAIIQAMVIVMTTTPTTMISSRYGIGADTAASLGGSDTSTILVVLLTPLGNRLPLSGLAMEGLSLGERGMTDGSSWME